MKNLVSIKDLGREGIEEVLRVTDSLYETGNGRIPRLAALKDKTVASLFYENSTRTRLSFETAARHLSAEVMSFDVSKSSVEKGESEKDTVKTLEALGANAIVVEHNTEGMPAKMTKWTNAAINAGDGQNEHPTQALLDTYTLWEHRNHSNFDGMKIAFVGDLQHSRVARSSIYAFSALGAEVITVGPDSLLSDELKHWAFDGSLEVLNELDDVIPKVDLVYLLRIQKERMDTNLFPDVAAYRNSYGLTAERAASLSSDAVIMHPGPMNRGIEIDDEVADSPHSLITRQVANGVAVRMATLFLSLGSGQ